MIRFCMKCGSEVEGVPSSIEQCECTELPALKFACPKCETVETIATGEPWRPTAYAAAAPLKVPA